MGLAVTFVLAASNLVISLLRNFIPDKVRIPAFVVVIAAFVTIVGMLMEAFVPNLYDALGLFIPLIVVNCIILARAESFASKYNPFYSFFDGIGMGLGFTAASDDTGHYPGNSRCRHHLWCILVCSKLRACHYHDTPSRCIYYSGIAAGSIEHKLDQKWQQKQAKQA
jgi:hypothetical protein